MRNAKTQPIVLVMAGGSGKRFWPASTEQMPKQFLTLWNKQSLIQQTVDRISSLVPHSHIFICSTEKYLPLIEEQLAWVRHPGWLIVEPASRNTAHCIMLSTLSLKRMGFSAKTPMIVLPCDHYIENEKEFHRVVKKGLDFLLLKDALLTFGIKPTSPHTGYGYIEADIKKGKKRYSSTAPIRRFVEKPDAETAKRYLEDGGFFWNAGIFTWTIGAIERAFQHYMRESWNSLSDGLGRLGKVYPQLPAISIDTAILEKSENSYVIPTNQLGWRDVGSWNALYELLQKNEDNKNVTLSGNTTFLESRDCLVRTSPYRRIALVGVEDIVVVEEGENLLILKRSKDQLVKELT